MPATLFLTVGLPGTGKTTGVRRLETEHRALRLTKDEWMKALYGSENPEQASDVIGAGSWGSAARPRTRHERRARLRALGQGRALQPPTGRRRSRRRGRDALLRRRP